MAYLFLFLVVIFVAYICAQIYLQVNSWVKKNVSNPFVGDVIRVIAFIILLPIPFIFLALGYIIGHGHFNKEN